MNTRIDTGTNAQVYNIYVDLNGHLRPRQNPTPGMYYFDGQIFYRKKVSNG